MKKTLLMIAAAFAIVGCAQEDLLSGYDGNTNGEIGAKAYVPSLSRGTALNNEGELVAAQNGFDLFAFLDDQSQFMGTADDGVAFQGTGSDPYTWEYVSANEVRFWSEAEGSDIQFFGVSPMKEKQPAGLTADITADAPILTYSVSADNAEQADVMYAVTEALSSTNEEADHVVNGITLQFRHALSQIVFKAKTESEHIYADIESVTLTSLHGKGVLSINDAEEYRKAADKSVVAFPWSYTDDAVTSYAAPVVETIDLNTDADGNTSVASGKYTTTTVGAISLTESSEAMLLLPQNLEDNEAKLDVVCKVRYKRGEGDVAEIVGNAGEYATITVPLTTAWEPGYKYTYTLVFTAQMGNPIKVQSVSVDEWNTVAEEEIQMDESITPEPVIAYELFATGLVSDGTNLLVRSADDLSEARDQSNSGASYYVGTEVDSDGNYPVYSVALDNEDDSDGGVLAPAGVDTNNFFAFAPYKQTADVDFEGAEWTPMMVNSYDGGGFAIENFAITEESVALLPVSSSTGSLFYAIDANIRNVHVKNAQIGTEEAPLEYAAAIVAECSRMDYEFEPIIDGCTVDENTEIYGTERVAGIYTNSGAPSMTITNCDNYATVVSTSYHASGISGTNANVISCNNHGIITGRLASGIICNLSYEEEVVDCHNYGTINGQDSAAGIANFAESFVIVASHNEGMLNLTGSGLVAGIVCDVYPIHFDDTAISLTGCYNVGVDAPLIAEIVYSHGYEEDATPLEIDIISCYNIPSSAGVTNTENAFIDNLRSVDEPNVIRPFTITIEDSYYTLATAAYSVADVDPSIVTIPAENSCIKLDSEGSVDYSVWQGEPMTAMNENLSTYTYTANSDNNHPLKLSGE